MKSNDENSSYRVIYISSSEYPSKSANSVQVVKQSNAFANIGYDVTVLGKSKLKITTSNEVLDIKEYYGVSSNVKIKLMDSMWFFPDVFRSISYPFWIAFNLRRQNDQIIYGRHVLGLLFSCIFCKPITLVYECHGPPSLLEYIGLRVLIMTRRLDRIIVISTALKRILLAKYPIFRKINIIIAHDGCDAPALMHSNQYNLSVGYVGSFYRGRGLELIAKIATRFPKILFHIIGGTLAELQQLLGGATPPNMIIHGRIPPAKLGSYFDLFNVALAPYGKITEVAGGGNTVEYMSPLKIFEYMQYGKAIIASDLPVLREILEDGVNAVLAKPDDLDDWCRSMELIQSYDLRSKLGSNAMEYAREKYTWKARANIVLDRLIYE